MTLPLELILPVDSPMTSTQHDPSGCFNPDQESVHLVSSVSMLVSTGEKLAGLDQIHQSKCTANQQKTGTLVPCIMVTVILTASQLKARSKLETQLDSPLTRPTTRMLIVWTSN